MPLFPISIEVEEVAVGRVLRKLHALEGVARINLSFAKEPEQIEQTVQAPARALTQPMQHRLAKFTSHGRLNSRGLPPQKNIAYRTIAEVLMKTPAHRRILQAAIHRVGIGGENSINGYIHRMTQLKFIQRTAPGTYRLTPKGEKLFSREGNFSLPKSEPGHGGWVIDNHKGVRKLVLDTLRQALENDPDQVGLVSSSDLTKVLEGAGFSAKNLSTTGVKMRNEGLMEYENGFYSIKEAGVAAIASPPVQHEADSEHSNHEGQMNYEG
jgi:hypothetical protein